MTVLMCLVTKTLLISILYSENAMAYIACNAEAPLMNTHDI